MPFFAVSATAPGILAYLREYHPNRLPSILEHGSAQRLKLQRAKSVLGWTAFAATAMGGVALLAASVSNSCSCEEHPILFVTWLATLLTSLVGFVGTAAYLQLRGAPAAVRPSLAGRTRYVPRPISEYKPFVSDHWGQPRDSGRKA
jgi:hypothetical protein